jgi:apolipoprotein N-acyltransferase
MIFLNKKEDVVLSLGYFFGLLLFSFLFWFFLNFFNKSIEFNYLLVLIFILLVNISGYLIKKYL